MDIIENDDKVLALTKGLPETYHIITTALCESSQFGNYQYVITNLFNKETIQGNDPDNDE